MSGGGEGRDAAAGASRSAPASAAPGLVLLLSALAVLVLPLLLAAAMPRLSPVIRDYLPALPLSLVEVEAVLVLALFALPAFAAPRPEAASPVLTGLVRGLFLAVLVLPFALAARAASPLPAGAILAGCALVAATGAGAACAAAAFGARGLAAAICAALLPGFVGFFGGAFELPLGPLAGLCPFLAADTAAHGGAAWTLGLLPGIALVATSALLRTKPARA